MKQVVSAHKVVGDQDKPGQITLRDLNGGRPVKYLRDILKKYQEEEKEDRYPERHGTINKAQAPIPLTTAEKRLERLKTALLGLMEEDSRVDGGIWAWKTRIRKILEENS